MLSLLDESGKFEREIIEIRRKVHSNPELSYKEFETAKFVASKLEQLGIEVTRNVGGTGVLGFLEGARSGKVVALRADMDALPVSEQVDVPFKSKRAGVMHACGHDAHVGMLLGAAMLLVRHKKDLYGAVKFLFQPAEEDGGKGGAGPMIADGVMRNPKVDYVFGLHIMGLAPSKTFALRGGALMAAPDEFKITIFGKGGHGALPDKTIDPIFVSAHVITALQGVKSRMIDQTQPLLVSVCSIHSGTKSNVIPDEAVLQGTIRTLDEKIRRKTKNHIASVAKSVCAAFGARCEIKYASETYPVTYNDPKVAEKVFKILRQVEGTRTVEIPPVMGAEDFSRFLQKAPGVYYFLGNHNKKKGSIFQNHSSKFTVDEDVLKFGTASLAMIAMEFTKP